MCPPSQDFRHPIGKKIVSVDRDSNGLKIVAHVVVFCRRYMSCRDEAEQSYIQSQKAETCPAILSSPEGRAHTMPPQPPKGYVER